MFDEGINITTDSDLIYSRIKMRDMGKTEISKGHKSTESGATFASVFGFAKSSLQKTFNFG